LNLGDRQENIADRLAHLDLQRNWQKEFCAGMNPLAAEPVEGFPGRVREGPIPGAILMKSILGVDSPG
jgi:hypothetical protein